MQDRKMYHLYQEVQNKNLNEPDMEESTKYRNVTAVKLFFRCN